MKRATYACIICAFITAPLVAFCGDGKGEEVKTSKVVSTFTIESFSVKEDGLICWTAKEENGSLPYIVEQFIYDKWVPVGEVNGIGTPTPNSYSVPVILSSGENKFRVRQKGYDKMSRFSNAVSYYSTREAVNYSIEDKNQTLVFSSDTYYIIYNPYGAIVQQGYGNSLDISNFPKGYYCLVYDNKLGGFEKKKVILKNTRFPIILNPIHFIHNKKLLEQL